jgi:hypothetical protein
MTMNKYRNRKVRTSDCIVHASQLEADRWIELKLLERAGKITNLKRQVKYVLIPAQYEAPVVVKNRKLKKGKLLERECYYKADFEYQDKETGEFIVEDAKGVRTKDYIIKRKLMLSVYGIRIKEV